MSENAYPRARVLRSACEHLRQAECNQLVVFHVRQSADTHRPDQRASTDGERKRAAARDVIARRQAKPGVEVIPLQFGFEPDLKRAAMKAMNDGTFAACPAEIVYGCAGQESAKTTSVPCRISIATGSSCDAARCLIRLPSFHAKS